MPVEIKSLYVVILASTLASIYLVKYLFPMIKNFNCLDTKGDEPKMFTPDQ